jgi:hypothetical protein
MEEEMQDTTESVHDSGNEKPDLQSPAPQTTMGDSIQNPLHVDPSPLPIVSVYAHRENNENVTSWLAKPNATTDSLVLGFYILDVAKFGMRWLESVHGERRISLYDRDITSLAPGRPLTDNAIDWLLASALETSAFPRHYLLLGAVDAPILATLCAHNPTSVVFRHLPMLADPLISSVVAIVYVESLQGGLGHWVTVQVDCTGSLRIFNSLKNFQGATDNACRTLASSLSTVLASISPRWTSRPPSHWDITQGNSLQQGPGLDCGLYAAANAHAVGTKGVAATANDMSTFFSREEAAARVPRCWQHHLAASSVDFPTLDVASSHAWSRITMSLNAELPEHDSNTTDTNTNDTTPNDNCDYEDEIDHDSNSSGDEETPPYNGFSDSGLPPAYSATCPRGLIDLQQEVFGDLVPVDASTVSWSSVRFKWALTAPRRAMGDICGHLLSLWPNDEQGHSGYMALSAFRF